MNLSLNLEKFWKFIKEWSVGRMTVLLVFITFIIFELNKINKLKTNFIFIITIEAIMLEIFELSHNKLKDEQQRSNKVVYSISMILSICSIIGFATYYLWQNNF